MMAGEAKQVRKKSMVKALLPCVLLAGFMVARADAPQQNLTEVAQAAEAHATRRAQKAHFEGIRAAAHRLDPRLQLAACGHALETFSSPGRAAGRSTVGVRCTAPVPWTLYVPVTVEASVKTVALRHSLPKGTVLQASDLVLQLQPAHSLRGEYISSTEIAAGKLLRRDLRSGTPIYINMLAVPNAIKRGQSTQLLAEMNNIEVKMQGTALASGAIGDVIAVRNDSSGKTVEGIVTVDGSVRIQ
jgi:flagella basal body P-ring formation protein FlgA